MIQSPKSLLLGAIGTIVAFGYISSNFLQSPQAKAIQSVPSRIAQVELTPQESVVENWSNPRLVHSLRHHWTEFERENAELLFLGALPEAFSYPIAISPDSRTLASAGTNSVRLWNLITGEEIGSPLQVTQGTTGWQAQSVAFSPNGQSLAVASDKQAQLQGSAFSLNAQYGLVGIWDLANRNHVSVDRGGASLGPHQILWGESRFAFYGRCPNERGCIRVFDGNQNNLNIPAYGSLGSSQFFDIHQTEKVLVTVSSGRNNSSQVQFVDLQDGRELRSLNTYHPNRNSSSEIEDGIFDTKNTVIFSPDESLLAISQGSSEVYLLEASDLRQRLNEEELRSISIIEPDYESQIIFMAISPDNQVLATASEDESVKLWSTETGNLIATIDITAAHLTFSSDGRHLVLSSTGGFIRVFSPQ